MTKPDLVLLHGWGLHAGAWDEVREALGDRFAVQTPDLPGHGAEPIAPTFEDAVTHVAAHVPRGAVLCGWSLGGLFAQRIASRAPDAISKLVLVSTTPCFVQRSGWTSAMRPETLAAFAAGLHADRERTLRDFVHLNALHGAHGREAVRAFTQLLAERPAPSLQALEASLAWLESVDLRGDIARLTMPVLVVHGARDALTPIEAGRWMAAHLVHARLEEIDDAAHLPFFTHRERFTRALESFVG